MGINCASMWSVCNAEKPITTRDQAIAMAISPNNPRDINCKGGAE